MKFFLYVPGMPFDGDFVKKPGFSLGGSESMGYYMAQGLAKRGHKVTVYCNLPGRPEPRKIDGVQYMWIGNPTKMTPFGDIWEKIALSVPCDVILGQRSPGLFAKAYHSKLNYWWAHDLGLKRWQGHMNAQLWNIDRVLGVSEFHRKQMMDVYGIDENYTGVLPNGIDLKLWPKEAINADAKIQSKILLYTHRPERGLENLVKQGGIMEKVLKLDPEITLCVAGYDNTTKEMEGYYNYLYGRCEQLPNVQNLGHLSKDQLAQVQMNSWLHVYPTEFEETSCITVMEEQAAGTPIVATRVGALTETLKSAGVRWSQIDQFHNVIKYLLQNPGKYKTLHREALDKKELFDIEKVIDGFESMVDRDFKNQTSNKEKLYYHFLRSSDVKAARVLAERSGIKAKELDKFRDLMKVDSSKTTEFYEDVAKKSVEAGDTHWIDNPDMFYGMFRMQPALKKLSELPDGARVLDYGCCVGQTTFAFAKKFKNLVFVGVDISETQIDIASAYALENGIENVSFQCASDPAGIEGEKFDMILCMDTLEHIWAHIGFMDRLRYWAKEDGLILFTTPRHPYVNDDQHQQHLHNFEEQDIRDMVGHKKGFDIVYIENPPTKRGDKAGTHGWWWNERKEEPVNAINYDRKFRVQKVKQTVSCCIILEKDSPTIEKTLRTIKLFADEVIIGVDDPKWLKTYKENAEQNLHNWTAVFADEEIIRLASKYNIKVFPIESPEKQGFAAARNETIKKATGDWIFWIDDDEDLIWPDRLYQYLRRNQFDSYGIPQCHFSAEPMGVIKIDMPSRLFRNNKGIRFYGVVHEHPETEINKGAGRTMLLPDKHGAIMHNAYDTEESRRARFIRNFPLMERDRKENPNRKLGMVLWVRDLAHKNRFEYEQTGQVTPEMEKRAREAIDLWRSIAPDSHLRMLGETMPYITECVDIVTKGGGLFFRLALDINSKGLGDAVKAPVDVAFTGKVELKQDLTMLYELLVKEKVDAIETITYI